MVTEGRKFSSPSSFLLLALFLLSSINSAAAQGDDNRCFLDGGGSTETFFVKESLPAGSLIGGLRIIGDPARDIRVRLEGADGLPVAIEPGTKDLVLKRELDREGVLGPSAVNVDVLCERVGGAEGEKNLQRRRNNKIDPDFTIPVSIRVTDVNDNAPSFVGSPYTLNVSELSLVGATVFGAVEAVDRDQPGPFSTVEYSVEGAYADYVTFENPLEGTLVLTKALDYETLQTFEVVIVARDQGSPPMESRVALTVNVKDADDQNPAFQYPRYAALLPRGGTQGQKLIVEPKDLRAFDKDVGLASPVFYTFASEGAGPGRYFELNRNTGHIYIRSDIPEDELRQPLTLVVRATQFDNADRYAVTTLEVSRGGIYDAELQFLQRSYAVKILENVPLNSAITTLITNRPSDRRVNFSIRESSLPGKEFGVNQKGEVILRKEIDFERIESYSFVVDANDGRKNDSATVNVTLININDWDPRFKYPQYEWEVSSEDRFQGFKIGVLEVHDGDKGDSVTMDVRGPHARAFRVSSRGELEIHNLSHLNSSVAHIVIVAEDSGQPPRRASVPVVVRFDGEPHGGGASRSLAAVGGVQGFFSEYSIFLIVIFAAVVVVFVSIILALGVYICKHKRKYDRSAFHSKMGGRMDANKIFASYYQRPSDFRGGSRAAGNNGSVNPILLGPGSSASRGSSSETLSSDPSAGQGPPPGARSTTGPPTALNPLNPRSGSQRYSKNAMLRVSPATTATAVATAILTPTPPPPPPPPQVTPSIHANGLPEVFSRPGSRTNVASIAISVDPMPNYGGGGNGSISFYSSANGHCGSVSSLRSGVSDNSQVALRENILSSSSRELSRIEWPRNSIPRRIKKLSWEDESVGGMYESAQSTTHYSAFGRDREISTLTDPHISVTPLPDQDNSIGTITDTRLGPQIGHALYF